MRLRDIARSRDAKRPTCYENVKRLGCAPYSRAARAGCDLFSGRARFNHLTGRRSAAAAPISRIFHIAGVRPIVKAKYLAPEHVNCRSLGAWQLDRVAVRTTHRRRRTGAGRTQC